MTSAFESEMRKPFDPDTATDAEKIIRASTIIIEGYEVGKEMQDALRSGALNTEEYSGMLMLLIGYTLEAVTVTLNIALGSTGSSDSTMDGPLS